MTTTHKVVRWGARVLAILAILFIASFGLDVFAPGVSLNAALVGFAIHSIPSVVLLVLLIVAWKWERIGGVLFVLVALLPFGLLSNASWVNAILAAPFLVTGVLFLTSAYMGKKSAAPEVPPGPSTPAL